MGKRLAFAIDALALLLIAVSLVSCSGKAFNDHGKNNRNDELDITQVTASPDAASNPTSPVPSDNSNEPNIIFKSVDFDSLLPTVEFGTPLLSFMNDDSEGKTYLFIDVSYSDVKDYSVLLIENGFAMQKHDYSKAKDYYNAEFYNSSENVYASINYSDSSLSLVVYLNDK